MDPCIRCGAGGIGGLLRLLREHGEALEADLQHYYGLPLSGVLTGEITWRRLRSLINGLPVDSSLGSVVDISESSGPATARPRWRHSDYILADVWDLLVAVNKDPKKKAATYPRPEKKGARSKQRETQARREALAARDERQHTEVDGG